MVTMWVRLVLVQIKEFIQETFWILCLLQFKTGRTYNMEKCYIILFFHHHFFRNSKVSVRKGKFKGMWKGIFCKKKSKAVMDLNKALRGLLKRASSHTYPRNQKEGFATRLSEHCWALSSHLIPALSAEAAIKANKTVSIIRKDA